MMTMTMKMTKTMIAMLLLLLMLIVVVVVATVDSVVVVLVRAVAIDHIVVVLVAVGEFVDFVDESGQPVLVYATIAVDFVVPIADSVVAIVLFVVVTLQHVQPLQ